MCIYCWKNEPFPRGCGLFLLGTAFSSLSWSPGATRERRRSELEPPRGQKEGPEGVVIPRTSLGLTPFILRNYFSSLLFQCSFTGGVDGETEQVNTSRGDLGLQWGPQQQEKSLLLKKPARTTAIKRQTGSDGKAADVRGCADAPCQ